MMSLDSSTSLRTRNTALQLQQHRNSAPHIDQAIRLISLTVVSAFELDSSDEAQDASQKNDQARSRKAFGEADNNDLELWNTPTVEG